MDGAVRDQGIHLGRGQPGKHLAFRIHQVGHVGQQHQLFSSQGLGDLAGDQVGVDVVAAAPGIDPNGGDYRDEVTRGEHFEQVGGDVVYFTHVPDVDNFGSGHLRGLVFYLEFAGANLGAILAGQTDGLAAALVDLVDDTFVDQAAEYHLHHVHGLGIGDSHAVDEARFNIEFFQQFTDLRPAAVYHHGIDADFFHQHHVTGKGVDQGIFSHGIAAVLDDDGLAGEALDIRQGFGEHLHYQPRITGCLGHAVSLKGTQKVRTLPSIR